MVDKAVWTSSTRAKIARADVHLHALYDLIDRWSDLKPCGIRREVNADGTEQTFYLQITGPPPPVWDWAALMGDALHNLRGALDHIVYSLAIRHTGIDPPERDSHLAFPITTDVDKFKSAKGRRLHGLPDHVIAAIQRAQPYNRTRKTGWQPLWWLSQLNDVDKHRALMLSPIAGYPDRIATNAEPGTYKALWNSGAYVDGTPILRFILAKPDPSVYVDLDMTAAVVIKTEGQPPIGVLPTMKSIRREVGTVTRYLTHFF